MPVTRPRPAALLSSLLALAAILPSTARAVDLGDRFELHGYGYQNYEHSSANAYLGADTHGSWDDNFLGLVFAATLTDRSKFWAQVEATSDGGTNFTWAFVDYDVTADVRAHAGRVKLPLGFYNEIIDAKMLQPAAIEPALYQSAADMVHDAYHGVGVDFEQETGVGHLRWQAWGGNVYDLEPPEDSRDRHAFGGRLTWQTPIEGATLMASAYRTGVEVLATGTMTNEDRGILSAGFSNDKWDVKAEIGRHKFMGVDSSAWYVQAAYALNDTWKPYARYDDVNLDRAASGPSTQQKTWVVGVGYRISESIGLKVENHFNDGYALPVADGDVAAGAGRRHWNFTVVQALFSF